VVDYLTFINFIILIIIIIISCSLMLYGYETLKKCIKKLLYTKCVREQDAENRWN
jgi:hypothetical protein